MYETLDDDDNGLGVLDGANNFVLHHGLVTLKQANQFSGRPEAYPKSHLKAFIDMCDTIRINQLSKDDIQLKLFTFSLHDIAKHWFDEIDLSNIRSWVELRKLFLDTYFPPCLAQKVMDEINHFVQIDDKSIYEAWERYENLLWKCPQHGLFISNHITLSLVV